MLSERAEEILEALWIEIEEQGKKLLELGASRDEPAIEELIKLGYIRKDTDHIHLLENGKAHAAGCVRRHRLAERLLVDVFDVKKKIIDEVSCKFEHLLHKGLEDNVCTILGHPKVCPHGKPIPSGRCCMEKADKKALKFVAPLTGLQPKDKGHIAYLQTKDRSQMQKLISIGAIPGVSIALLQKFPSYVFQIGQSQFAVDKELATAIYVRLAK
ncbi:MAG: metal-dependent transcriptional regulator [Candidatus Omnitrophica bacterium]|nr:metal-dependent transcriptional regulator [Candidatus Omnitrophota bacterium]